MEASGISVVVPVYDAGHYLRPCLDSLLAQDIDPALVEIIAVDDGSTDGSAAILDAYAATDRRIRVIHQYNSGGPGRPRNVGMDASGREYVFFVDADDYLGPEALRRMYEFASQNGCDVASPRIVGDGRFVHARAWAQTQVDADLKLAFLTYSPQKLFLKSFVREQGLRFLEGRARFEDGVFVSRAYLTASRVSLLGDYDYYFIRLRDDNGNRSHGASSPHAYAESQRIVIDNIRELCRDPGLAEYLVLDLYRRKTLKPFSPTRFPSWSEERRRDCVEAAGKLAASHVPQELEDRLPFPFNLRSHLARIGDLEALLDHAIAAEKGQVQGRLVNGRVLVDVDTIEGPKTYDATGGVRIRAELERVGRRPGKLLIHGRARVDGIEVDGLAVRLVLRERTIRAERVLPLRQYDDTNEGWIGFEAAVPGRAFPAKPPANHEVWSLLVRSDLGEYAQPEGRLAVPGGRRRKASLPVSLPIRRARFEARPYVTRYGNLAVRVEALAMSRTRCRIRAAIVGLRAARAASYDACDGAADPQMGRSFATRADRRGTNCL